MSPLWSSEGKMQPKINNKRPSPNNDKNNLSPAQDFNSYPGRRILCQSMKSDDIKGISPFISLIHRIAMLKFKGSMTVEASLLLPIFLLFFLNLGSAMEMIRLHCNMELALWEIGNRVSVYGYVLEDPEKTAQAQKSSAWLEELAGIALSYTYIRNEMVEYMGKSYLDASPLTYGANGLQFLESNLLSEDTFEVIVTYAISPWSDVAGFRSFRMANRYYGHLWTGYEIPVSDSHTEQITVYVTEYGTVYHEDRECTHIRLSVQETSLQDALSATNTQGEKYACCERCKVFAPEDTVYITSRGTCYHYTRDCPGIKRIVYSMLKTQADKYTPCNRCVSS